MEQKKQDTDPINRLKRELFKQKEAVSDIGRLVKSEIDRDYSMDLWELSERELDNEMGNRLSFLNDDIDTRPDTGAISSHRRFLGKPVVLIKKLFMKITGFYTNSLLEKQRRFNQQAVAFHLATFVRLRRNDERIKSIEEKLKVLHEDQELLLEQLDRLKNESDTTGNTNND